MSDDNEYDIFGNLDQLCKNKTLGKFKETKPANSNKKQIGSCSSSDDEHALDSSDAVLRSPKRKTKKNNFVFPTTKTDSPPMRCSPPPKTLASITSISKAAATTAATATKSIGVAAPERSALGTVESNVSMSASMAAVMNIAIESALQAAIADKRGVGGGRGGRRTRSTINRLAAEANLTGLLASSTGSVVPPANAAKRSGKKKRTAADTVVAALAPTISAPTITAPSVAAAIVVPTVTAAAAKRGRGKNQTTVATPTVVAPPVAAAIPAPEPTLAEPQLVPVVSAPVVPAPVVPTPPISIPGQQTIVQYFQQSVANTASPGRTTRNTTRTLRNTEIAEIAARAPTVGFVDLVTSPIPPIYGVVNVDSDDEDGETIQPTQSTIVTNDDLLDLSFDEENPELSIKINFNGEPEVFKLRKYQKFLHMFKSLAARENTNMENVVLNLNSKIITAQDTPASINYKIYNFIDGRVLTQKLNVAVPMKKSRDVNKIILKIQADQWKRPLQMDLLKTDKFKILYIKCAEELNIPYNNMKLSFDGELLEYNATPVDLDLEGGEAIDLRIKK